MKTLVIAEHSGGQIRLGSRCALSVARDLAAGSLGELDILVLGNDLAPVADDAGRFGNVIVADSPVLAYPTADRYARIIADVAQARGSEAILANSTTFAKDILPRTAALLDAAMATDVTGYSLENGELLLRRPVYAGSAVATITLSGTPQIITVRGTSFPAAPPLDHACDRVDWQVDASSISDLIEYVGIESRSTCRPDLTEARVVVSGGRPFRSSEEFETCVGRLADVFAGAAGCTRALVDAGIAPNEWQVGQTGKVVAPELYVALGISGAIQHVAGMKNSRIIVAINSDPEAPMFSIANYGLIGDVHHVVPQLIECLTHE